jgi:formamidopyrimidine-DNA glycosylase
MPELPEVETIVQALRPHLEGRRFTRYISRWAKQAVPSTAAVRRGIVGRRITRLWRRAKFIAADLEDSGGPGRRSRGERAASDQHFGGHLLIHLRMSGRFDWADRPNHKRRHIRAAFDLDDGRRLLFCDMRKFAKIIYTTELDAVTGQLGIEPLERQFTATALERALYGRARQLKPLLLDQTVIAGLGNIYTDEALFQAGLHPTACSERLSREEIERLRTAIRAVLRKAIRHRGTSFDEAYLGGGMQKYLDVYGRAGLPCRRCKTPIERLRIAQRGTHVCPNCQPFDGKC